jgi:hypothetical protein
MFLTLGGFVVVILLLESAALQDWADHLDPGLLRSAAQPVAFAINRTLQPLGIAGIRNHTLDEAARMGWSDDAVRIAHMARSPEEHGAASDLSSKHPSPAPALGDLPPESKSILNAAAVSPIVGSVPHSVSLTPLPPIQQGRPRVVVLAGDSMMAVGFGAGLMRKAGEEKNLRFLRAFKSGTGLARPDVFNWMDQYPAMLGSEKPDVVIVAIGANDCQSFVVDSKVVLFGTEEWRKTYQSRVAAFLTLMESTGARVLWVGLPPMRSLPFNQRISLVNRIAYTVVSQDPNASWWSTAAFVGDASGSYREFAQLPNGTSVRLRATDGIHFAEEGASTMTAALINWLDPSLDSADGAHRPRTALPALPLVPDQQFPPLVVAHSEPTHH